MIIALIQARMSSSRLPGKVLMPLFGKPLLIRLVERVKRASFINKIIITTSSEQSDDPIETLCDENNISCFRGKLHDVLDRYYCAAVSNNAKHIVRLTGDSPLLDPEIIDAAISLYFEEGCDYLNNDAVPTFPDGLDVEVFNMHSLKLAWEEARLSSEREHVTPYIYNNPDKFSIALLKNDIDLSKLRWTVDEPEDFKLVSEIYQELYPKNPLFGTSDILELLNLRPELNEINNSIKRNEGYEKSLKQDIADANR